MTWVKGQSGNPSGRAPGQAALQEDFRKRFSAETLEALGEAIQKRESWAVTLAAHYCLGKPSEFKFDANALSKDELRAIIRVKFADELGIGAGTAPKPPATGEASEPH